MCIVLPSSIFYHVGRTGGHWASHVLWKAGLVEARLSPLHLTPAQAKSRGDLPDKPFAFCFVRHPLNWLASLWMHETEFGWSDSEMSRAAATGNFAQWLEGLLEAWPSGPCGHAMAPYIDHCDFVGRTESLAQDLGRALTAAGESFDPALLLEPPINQTSIQRIREAARAPADLLKRVMESEAAFNARFSYAGVPAHLVGEPTRQIWPVLKSRPADDNSVLEAGMIMPRFDYHFDQGAPILSAGHESATQWGLIEAMSDLSSGDCAVVSESDPYFAYLAADLGCAPVTFVKGHDAVVAGCWRERLASQVGEVDFVDFMRTSKPQHDTLVLCDSLDISPAFETELAHAALVVKPGGILIFTAPLLFVDDPIKLIWEPAAGSTGRKLAYESLAYLRRLLAPLGFVDVAIVREMFEAPSEEIRPQVEAVARRYGADSTRLIGKAIVRARLSDGGLGALERHALVDLWIGRRPAEFLSTPCEGLPKAAQATIAMLREALAYEHAKRVAAEQGMADRERELIETRVNVAALANDANYSRDQIARARQEAGDAAQRLNRLQQQIELLGVQALIIPPAGDGPDGAG